MTSKPKKFSRRTIEAMTKKGIGRFEHFLLPNFVSLLNQAFRGYKFRMRFKHILYFIFSALFALSVHASEEEDFKFIEETLRPAIYVTTQDHVMWNWFSAENRDPGWKKPFEPDDQRGFDHLRSQSEYYFQGLCPVEKDPAEFPEILTPKPADCPKPGYQSYGRGGFWGSGLYLALDPSSTSWFGGSQGVLMQVNVPKGFRYLDAQEAFAKLPSDKMDLLTAAINRLGCSLAGEDEFYFWKSSKFLALGSDRYTQVSSEVLNFDTCRLITRKILKERLQLDGFNYEYNSQPGAWNCAIDTGSEIPGNYNRARAFVVISSRLFSAADVKVLGPVPSASEKSLAFSNFIKDLSGFVDTVSRPELKNEKELFLNKWMKKNMYACTPHFGAQHEIQH